MAEAVKTIYCPRCNRKVATWDGKSSINPIGKCKKCNWLIIYDLNREELRIKDVPDRATSSGLTFY